MLVCFLSTPQYHQHLVVVVFLHSVRSEGEQRLGMTFPSAVARSQRLLKQTKMEKKAPRKGSVRRVKQRRGVTSTW